MQFFEKSEKIACEKIKISLYTTSKKANKSQSEKKKGPLA
jgi:hypothetical protein